MTVLVGIAVSFVLFECSYDSYFLYMNNNKVIKMGYLKRNILSGSVFLGWCSGTYLETLALKPMYILDVFDNTVK